MSIVEKLKFTWLSKSQEPVNLNQFKEISWLITWIMAIIIVILIVILSYNFSLEVDDVAVRDRFDRTEVPISLYSAESVVRILRDSFQIGLNSLDINDLDEFFQKFGVQLVGSDCRSGVIPCEEGDFHFAGRVDHEGDVYIVFSHTTGILDEFPDQPDRIMRFTERSCKIITSSLHCAPPDFTICEKICVDSPVEDSWNLSKVVEIGRPGQIVFKSVERSRLNIISFALSSFITGMGIMSIIIKIFLIKVKSDNVQTCSSDIQLS